MLYFPPVPHTTLHACFPRLPPRLVVVGESGVGKSSLVNRFAQNEYNPNFIATIGVDFRVTGEKVDGKAVKFQLWDTAGQERFSPIVTTYYRGAHAIVLVYDRTDLTTLHAAAGKWMRQVNDYARANAPVLLVGNKGDLVPPASPGLADTGPEVMGASSTRSGALIPSPEDVDAEVEAVLRESPFADRIFAHIVTSAKTGDNVSGVFQTLARHMLTLDPTALGGMSAKEEVEGGRKARLDIARMGGPALDVEEEASCCVIS